MALLTACNHATEQTAPVVGTVTCNGQPVSEGTVCFYPEQGRLACGTLDANGRYRLTTYQRGDGAVVGPHKVTIESRRLEQAAPPKDTTVNDIPLGGGAFEIIWLVPQHYSQRQTTPLRAQVESKSNVIDFEIPNSE